MKCLINSISYCITGKIKIVGVYSDLPTLLVSNIGNDSGAMCFNIYYEILRSMRSTQDLYWVRSRDKG